MRSSGLEEVSRSDRRPDTAKIFFPLSSTAFKALLGEPPGGIWPPLKSYSFPSASEYRRWGEASASRQPFRRFAGVKADWYPPGAPSRSSGGEAKGLKAPTPLWFSMLIGEQSRLGGANWWWRCRSDGGKSLLGNPGGTAPWRWYIDAKVYEPLLNGKWTSFSTETGTPNGRGCWQGMEASREASAVEARTMRAGEARGLGR